MLRRTFRSLQSYAEVLGWYHSLKMAAALALRRPTVDLRIAPLGTSIRLRPRESDRHVLAQVLIERDSDIPLHRPRLIVDGGANVGFASALFAARYPSATIVAVEPHVENCELLNHNCSAFPNVIVVEGALWHRTAMLRIRNPEAAPWAYAVEEVPSSDAGGVAGYSVSDIARHAGCETIDSLKLDIEGAELPLFSHPTPWLEKVKVLVVETHGSAARAAVRMAINESECNFSSSQRGEKYVFTNLDLVS